MKRKSKTAMALGGLFLSIGILWFSVIFIRCEGALSRSKEGAKTSYQKIQEQLTERILEKKIKSFSLRKHSPKIFVIQFWTIAGTEVLCALLFFVSGLALLRGYPFQRKLAAGALMVDIFLKALILTYHHYILMPLKPVFDDKNILFMYFTPDGSLTSKISLWISGVKLLQKGPSSLYYALFYAVFMAGVIYVVTCPKMKKHFDKS